MEKQSTHRPLDKIDLKLIQELEVDARMSYLDLAAAMDTNHHIVRRRLQKMLDAGILSFATMVDHRALGYLTQASLGINTIPGKVDAVASQLVPFQNIQTIIATIGCYDLMLSIVVRDFDDLLDFIRREIGSIPDITSVETLIVLKTFKYDWPYMGGKEYGLRHRPNDFILDAVDLSLIGELERSPRETISQLAKNLGVSRTTVSKKLQALLDNSIIRVISVPDLSAIGYNSWTVLRLKVQASKIYDVAEALIGYPNITHVVLTTGRYEISSSAIFKDRDDMHDFLVNKLGTIPGIMHHETLLNTKSYKRSFRLLSNQHEE